MKKIFLSLVITVLIAFACNDRDDQLFGANIRINNKSTIDFNSVTVRVDSLVFENIPADSFSDYLEFEAAFAIDTITIETNGEQFNLMPDSTGNALPTGLYTYELDFSEEGELEFNFRVD